MSTGSGVVHSGCTTMILCVFVPIRQILSWLRSTAFPVLVPKVAVGGVREVEMPIPLSLGPNGPPPAKPPARTRRDVGRSHRAVRTGVVDHAAVHHPRA